MEKSSKILVVCLVGLLGILSSGTGFGAEVTRIKASDITADIRSGECVYPENPATALGIAAVVSLMMAQGILMGATGCFCCSKAARSNCSLRFISAISGLAFFIATGLLITGATLNNGTRSGTTRVGDYYALRCYYAKPGVFAGGAFLSGASAMFGIFYFLAMTKSINKSPNDMAPSGQEGIPVGQPQMPPINTNVVANV